MGINDIPDQHGKCIVITGANSGIGYEAALALAGKGAEVVLAVRNREQGEQAIVAIRHAHPHAIVEAMPLDLTDLSCVRQFAESFLKRHMAMSVHVNNAGVMGIPFRRTVDGFEMQFGTNHLGHGALTGLLLPLLAETPQARVVSVSSMMHRFGEIDFGNLNGEKVYKPWSTYTQSKLANLLFAQSAAMGALPTLYTATASGVSGGQYIGPLGLGKMRGYPGPVQSSARSYDVATAKELWCVSEELTAVHYS